jgi:hypothetical protein
MSSLSIGYLYNCSFCQYLSNFVSNAYIHLQPLHTCITAILLSSTDQSNECIPISFWHKYCRKAMRCRNQTIPGETHEEHASNIARCGEFYAGNIHTTCPESHLDARPASSGSISPPTYGSRKSRVGRAQFSLRVTRVYVTGSAYRLHGLSKRQQNGLMAVSGAECVFCVGLFAHVLSNVPGKW